MRAQVARRTETMALLLSAGFMLGHQVIPAMAGDARVDPFRILFAEGSSTPYQAGEYAERNRLAVQHIARMLAHWGENPGMRFLFVAARRTTCGATSPCNPDYLLWQRLNATAALLRNAASTSRNAIAFHRIGQAFQDEFRVPPDLPPPPVDASAIDLRTYVDPSTSISPSCPWQFLFFHPDLPPVIGEADRRPMVPIAANGSLGIARNALIRTTTEPKIASGRMAIWENQRGEFAKAAPSIFSIDGASIPIAAKRLHVFVPSIADHEWQEFLARLGSEFTPVTPVPKPLQDHLTRSAAKGMGDDVQPLPPTGIRPSHPDPPAFHHCYLTFWDTLTTPPDSSR